MKLPLIAAYAAALALHAAVLATSKTTASSPRMPKERVYVQVELSSPPLVASRMQPTLQAIPTPALKRRLTSKHQAVTSSVPVLSEGAAPQPSVEAAAPPAAVGVPDPVAGANSLRSQPMAASALARPVPLSPVPRKYVSMTQPSYARTVEPVYPLVSRRQRQQGDVRLTLFINERGSLDKVSVARSSGYAQLDEAAVTAMTQSRFHPAYQFGKPVLSRVDVTIAFQLR